METKDIISDLVSSLSRTVNILGNQVVDGNIVLTLDCTYWLMVESKYEIDGKIYRVVSIVDKVVTFKPLITGSVITVDSFVLSGPVYFNGTLKMVKQEVNNQYDKEKILPMIWLREVFEDDKTNDEESMIDRSTDIRLYFVASANYTDWLYNDHYDHVIYPMQTMVEAFLALIRRSRFFTDVFDYRKTNLINISVEGNQESSIFDINLTGIELRIFSEIRKDLNCKTNCL